MGASLASRRRQRRDAQLAYSCPHPTYKRAQDGPWQGPRGGAARSTIRIGKPKTSRIATPAHPLGGTPAIPDPRPLPHMHAARAPAPSQGYRVTPADGYRAAGYPSRVTIVDELSLNV